MSSTANPQIDPRMLEETRRHIGRLIDEVGRLSESELPPAEYYAEVLKRVLSAMAAPAGAVWTRTPQGNIQLAFQVNLREVGLNEDARRVHDELLRQAVQNPQPIHLLPHSGAGAAHDGRAAAGNPTNFLLLLVPVMLNSEVHGFLEVWQSPDRPLNAVPGFLQFMGTIADQMARHARNQLMGHMVGQQQVWTQLELFARQIHATLNPTEVSYLVANEGRRLVDCDRVSVGIRQGRKARVEAVSGSDVVEKRSNLVKLMRALFDSVLRWGEKLVYTGVKDDSLPPDVLHALDGYLAESNSKVLVLLPLRDEREKESKRPPRSGLLMECFETTEETQQIIARLEVVGRHSASALYNAVEYRRIPMRWVWLPLAKLQEGLGGKARAILLIILLSFVGIAGALYFIPYPLKMDARGNLLPVVRRWVYAGEKGRVVKIDKQPNDSFPANDNLIELHNWQLYHEAVVAEASVEAARGKLEEARKRNVSRSPDANDKKDLEVAEAELAIATAKRDGLMRGLAFHPINKGSFFILAPEFPDLTRDERKNRDEYHRYLREMKLPVQEDRIWKLLSSDVRENLLGNEVDPTKPLMRLGDMSAGWEIELKIPQKHLYQVQAAYRNLNVKELDVDLKVRTEPTRTFRGKLPLDRIGGEATPQRDDNNEPEPVVTAYVLLDHEDIPMDERVPLIHRITGTEVLAKVRCGDARMGYSLFYGVWEFICEKVLFSF